MFVEGSNSLGRKLTSEPVGFLDETYAAPGSRRSQGSGDAASSRADNQHVTGNIICGIVFVDANHGCARIARKRNPHHVDKSFEAPFQEPTLLPIW
jgi:hypothetical protein